MKHNPLTPQMPAGQKGGREEKLTARQAAAAEAAAPSPVGGEGEAFEPVTFETLDEHIVTALHAAADKKALAPALLDLRPVASFTDFFLVVSGANVRQVQAVADEVAERLKAAGRRAARVEGYNAAEWVLLDYGDFIVHVFEEKARRFYDLERLWRDASRVALPAELTGGNAGAGGERAEG